MKWPILHLSEIAKMVGGGTPSKNRAEFWSGSIPWVSPKDMNQREIRDTEDHISEEAVAESATQIVSEGSVLIVVRSGILVRRFPVAIARVPVALNQDMKALAPHESILPDFLAYFLESSSERVLSQCVKRGATVHSIDIGRLEQLPVPVPTKSEQRRIVDVLDEAVELYKRRADADVKSARILPALFEEMFGDPVANPRRWPTAPLEEVVEIGTQLVDPNRAQYLDVLHIGGEQIEKDSGRILSPSLVRHSDLRSGKFLFTAEHVLYSKIRPYLNKVAYPRFNGVCSADIYPLRAKDGRLSPWYLVALLRSRAFLDYAKLHSGRLRMAKLNREQLGSFKVPLPEPSLREAFEALAVRLAELEPERLQIRDKMDQLFQVLLHGAFAGELTANWRQARSKELLVEMEHQAKVLNLPREALLC